MQFQTFSLRPQLLVLSIQYTYYELIAKNTNKKNIVLRFVKICFFLFLLSTKTVVSLTLNKNKLKL